MRSQETSSAEEDDGEHVRRMTAFEAYETYLAVKLHFDRQSYDYFKFNGKTRVTPSSFEKRKDRYFFEKAAAKLSKDHFIHRLLVQIRDSSAVWIKDIFESDNLTKALVIEDYHKRFPFKFEEDIIKIKTYMLVNSKKLSELMLPSSGYSYIFKRYVAGDFLPEFVLGLNTAFTMFKTWDKTLEVDPVWSNKHYFLKKYNSFVSNSIPDKAILRQIILDKLQGI